MKLSMKTFVEQFKNKIYISIGKFLRKFTIGKQVEVKITQIRKTKSYISAFKEISDLDDEEKINFFKETKRRKKLPGILEPIASTILHFKYPDKFPIIDVRTVGTLRDKGLLRTKTISYNDYREEIFEIFKKCKGEFNLRKIDRALFTYNEEKQKLLRVLEGKKSIDDVAKRLLIPQERKMELIRDLEKDFKEKLEKLNDLKN